MRKTYIVTKIIKAEPMELSVFNETQGKPTPLDSNLKVDETPGYQVEYEDGYISWSPKEVFDRCGREITASEAKLIVGDGNVFVVGKPISVEDETNG